MLVRSNALDRYRIFGATPLKAVPALLCAMLSFAPTAAPPADEAQARLDLLAAVGAHGGHGALERIEDTAAAGTIAVRRDGSPVPDRPIEIDLDRETSLVRALRFWERSRDGRPLPEPVEYRYSDYRRVGALTVPFRVEEVRNGTVLSTVSLTSFSDARHGEIFVEP